MDKRKNKKISTVLTDREKVFVVFYLESLNAKDAAEKNEKYENNNCGF